MPKATSVAAEQKLLRWRLGVNQPRLSHQFGSDFGGGLLGAILAKMSLSWKLDPADFSIAA